MAKRVAHGHDPVADAHRVTVTKGDERQGFVALDLQKGDVGVRIGPNNDGIQRLAREEFDLDLISLFDDVIIGNNEPVLGDHKARAQRLTTALTRGAVAIGVAEFTKEILKRGAFGNHGTGAGVGLNRGRSGDVHHGRTDLIGQIGETFRGAARLGGDGLRHHQSQPHDQGHHGLCGAIGGCSGCYDCLSLHVTSSTDDLFDLGNGVVCPVPLLFR